MCSFGDQVGKAEQVTIKFYETRNRWRHRESHSTTIDKKNQKEVKSTKTIDSPEYAQLDGYEILRISDLLRKLLPEHKQKYN